MEARKEDEPTKARDRFEETVEGAMPSLRRWARSKLPSCLWSRVDPEDLVQDAILSTWKRIDGLSFADESSLCAYLRTAVRNRIRDEMRRAPATVPVSVDTADLPQPTTGSALDRLVTSERIHGYHRALDELPVADALAIVLRFEFGHKFEEIALGTGKPSPDSARMTVNRAMKKLGGLMQCA